MSGGTIAGGGIDDATVRAAFASSRIPMALLDDRRRFVEVNEGAATLLGAEREELLGAAVDDFVAPGTGERLERCWRGFLDSGAHTGAVRLLLPSGSRIRVPCTATANVAAGVHVAICSGEPESAPGDDGPARTRALSGREREVLSALAAGETGDEIAQELFIAPETVRRHVANARAKLDARTRVHAVAEAMRRGEIAF